MENYKKQEKEKNSPFAGIDDIGQRCHGTNG